MGPHAVTFAVDDNDQLPCPLCVTWVDPPPDETGYVDQGDAVPHVPVCTDGQWKLEAVPTLYHSVHATCQRSVDRMHDER